MFIKQKKSEGGVLGPHRVPSGIVVVKVVQDRKVGALTRHQIQNELVDKMRVDTGLERSRGTIEEICNGLKKAMNLCAAALDLGLDFKQIDAFVAGSGVSGIGKDSTFTDYVFSCPTGAISAPLRGAKAWYIIQVLDRNVPVNLRKSEFFDIVYKQTLEERKNRYFEEWFTCELKNAVVIDNRWLYLEEE